eukprot:3891350-Pyramimonas_sp.AAC.1
MELKASRIPRACRNPSSHLGSWRHQLGIESHLSPSAWERRERGWNSPGGSGPPMCTPHSIPIDTRGKFQ